MFKKLASQSSTMLLYALILFSLLVGKSTESLVSAADNESLALPESTPRDLGVRLRLKEKPSLLHHPVFLLDRFSPGDPVLPSPDGKGPNCRREAKCERLNNTMCLGVKLPYSSTTFELVGMTQEQIQEKLQFWMALKHVPRCWAVIQPFLCALYMPRCDDDLVDLPSQEMCKMALGPCRILELERGWTSPLRCDDTSRFPPLCKVSSFFFIENVTSHAPLNQINQMDYFVNRMMYVKCASIQLLNAWHHWYPQTALLPFMKVQKVVVCSVPIPCLPPMNIDRYMSLLLGLEVFAWL